MDASEKTILGCAFCGRSFGPYHAFAHLVWHQRTKHFHQNSVFKKLMEIRLTRKHGGLGV